MTPSKWKHAAAPGWAAHLNHSYAEALRQEVWSETGEYPKAEVVQGKRRDVPCWVNLRIRFTNKMF